MRRRVNTSQLASWREAKVPSSLFVYCPPPITSCSYHVLTPFNVAEGMRNNPKQTDKADPATRLSAVFVE